MSEIRTILRTANDLRQRGEPFLVATLVRVRGSSYRRPGARMVVSGDRWMAGSLSGGCLEGDIARKGWFRTRNGCPAIITYDSTVSGGAERSDGGGFGLGCEGIVDVLIERAGAAGRLDALSFIETTVDKQMPGALATCLDGLEGRVHIGARVGLRADGSIESDGIDPMVSGAMLAECKRVLAGGEGRVAICAIDGANVEVFVEAVTPPVRLFVLGAGHDAVPVVAFARALGWDVAVCEPMARLSTRERFGEAVLAASLESIGSLVDASHRAAAVVMAHDYERDRAALGTLLKTRAMYVGALGPRRRTLRMLADLGVDTSDPRLHAPVGLDLGAETPQEIALSIVAEVQVALGHSSAEGLRRRPGSIHSAEASQEAAE